MSMLPFNGGYWQVHSFGSKFPNKFRNWHLAGCALSDPRNWKIALQKKNVLQLIRLDLTLQVKDIELNKKIVIYYLWL